MGNKTGSFFSGRRGRIRAAGFLAAAFAVTAGFAVQGHAQAAAYRHLLNNGYQHAFAELTTAVSELDVALQKGQYATTPALFSALCTQAYGKAMSAQMAIGELPYGNLELEQTASFLAKAGDYAVYLSRSALSGGCTDQERETLRQVAAAASSLNTTLQSLQTDLSSGALTLEDLEQAQARLSQATQEGGEVLAGSAFQNVEADFPEIPSLIYDGPFSDHIASRSPRMLEGQSEVSRDEARTRAAQLLGLRPEIFEPVSDGAGQIPTWGFAAAVDGGELYVEMTKAGGELYAVLSSRTVDTDTLTPEQGADIAAKFLADGGYGDMAPTYSTHVGNIVTVNFAARQGDVICYPDLLVVSVALDNGAVVGFEGEGYLMNHTQRELTQPAISLAQAQLVVGDGLDILSHQLAVIPTGGENEVFCHEFKCETDQGGHAILYVNAQTGQEEKLLLLLEDESGTLVI